MTGLVDVPVAPLPLARMRGVVGREQWAEIAAARDRSRQVLDGRVIWNVNSTANGGGVAEMIRSLIAYGRGAGLDARWVVIGGNREFFALTKRLHNRMHGHPGDGGPLGPHEHDVYEAALADSARRLRRIARDGDIVLLHDPQTAGLVPELQNGIQVVWRSHIGHDAINEHTQQAWDFLLDYVTPAAGWIFSRQAYVPPGLDPDRVTIIPPSIDGFSPKNQPLRAPAVGAILHAAGMVEGPHRRATPAFRRQDGTPGRVDRRADLCGGEPAPTDRPLVVQVSRWDRLKDPLGVLEGFLRHVAPATEADLVLAGPAVAAVSDDPEGAEVLGEVRARWELLPERDRRRIHLLCLPMEDPEENAAIVNALQRAAAVVVQKSIAEGFGLTVAEAMWKGRPVVASSVGGIRDQIEDGVTGILLRDPSDLEAFGAAVRRLLEDPLAAAALGEAARESVRRHYLNGRHLVQYATLFERLTQRTPAAVG